MSEVLIVVEHAGSHVSKPAFELLTLARRLGDRSLSFSVRRTTQPPKRSVSTGPPGCCRLRIPQSRTISSHPRRKPWHRSPRPCSPPRS
jgi:hypothetical protein